jgi:peptidoglycan/xylan/chitin deacetylase (PgdA/CDA1 family)
VAAEERFARMSRSAVTRPQGAAQVVKHLVRHAAISAAAQIDRRSEPAFLRCLYFHYVFDDQREKFREIISGLQKIGRFVTTDEVIDMIEGRRVIDGRFFHVSFDDGFKNIYENAAPILHDLGVPAITFVPSRRIEIDYETTRRYCLETTRYPDVIETNTWDELARLPELGVEVGSHTRTHARFSQLDSTAAYEDEISGSKRDLEEKLGRECRYIAWPYGSLADADSASLGAVREAGYRACFGAFRGTIEPQRTNLFAIPRHHIKPEWPLGHIHYFARGNMEESGRIRAES